jgi:hypothetical protein
MVGWAATAGLAAVAGTLAASAAAPKIPSVSCDSAVQIDPPATPGADWRIVANRVAMPPRERSGDPSRTGGAFPWWRKTPILIRPRRTPVDVIVPRAWRSRARVTWTTSGPRASRVRFRGCAPFPGEDWLFYNGGFELRSPACVPLVIRAGKKHGTLRFSVGAPC